MAQGSERGRCSGGLIAKPREPDVDYAVPIFTQVGELPFAGLVPIRRIDGVLAFAAPPTTRSGPVSPQDFERIARILGIGVSDIVDSAWADNGPAQWPVGTGRATPPYVASQGAAMERVGRPRISQDEEGGIWVGGATHTVVMGGVEVE